MCRSVSVVALGIHRKSPMGFDVKRLEQILAPIIGPKKTKNKTNDTTINLRYLRAFCTMICCSCGAGYVLYNDWFVGDWTAFVYVELAVRIWVFNPLGDYSLHRLLHALPSTVLGKYHHDHHLEIKLPNGDPNAEFLEVWPYPVAMFCYYCPYTKWITLGLLQYAWFHQLSHDLPELVPATARHHGIHHTSPYKNHSVSLSWPDRVFGTYQAEPNPNYKPRSRVTFMLEYESKNYGETPKAL